MPDRLAFGAEEGMSALLLYSREVVSVAKRSDQGDGVLGIYE